MSRFSAFFRQLLQSIPRLPIPRSRWLWRDGFGLFLIFIGAVLMLTALGLNTGGLIGSIAGFLRRAFGTGVYVFCLLIIGVGVPIALNTPIHSGARLWRRVIVAEIGFCALLGFLHAFNAALAGSQSAALMATTGQAGGAVGWVLTTLLSRWVIGDGAGARLLTVFIWLGLMLISAAILMFPSLAVLIRERLNRNQQQTNAEVQIPLLPEKPRTIAPKIKPAAIPIPPQPAPESPKPSPKPKPKPKLSEPEAPIAQPLPEPPIVPPQPSAKKAVSKTTEKPQPVVTMRPRSDNLPPLSLLALSKNNKVNTADIDQQARVIEQTLRHFGLVGTVLEMRRGPAVTQFGVEPGYIERPGPNGEMRQQKIRVGQIAALHNDFALALSASSLRIEAPIPGKHLVGIEVPNPSISTVDLRGVMESEAFQKINAPLAVALGQDVSGQNIAADLGRMPHVLIAGTTGSGKSVCMSALITCLAMNNRPEDLKLILIDPKRVELTRFASLPHVLGKPESDHERIPGVLRWVTREMDRRYQRFATTGSRNIADYNASIERELKSNQLARPSNLPTPEKLPRMVVLIDELADLMLQTPVETEKTLCRLAQMARATGIHLVVATQRPSVDVVTGLIKANFPARISFSVASSTDSRVILDQVGAEQLLGRGDMLFLNPEAGTPMRVQGCFVSDKEMDNMLAWWENEMGSTVPQQANPPELGALVTSEALPWESMVGEVASELARSGGKAGRGGRGGDSDEAEDGDDNLIEKAMEIIRTSGSVSTSLLQRKLRIGYPRAARLMEELQQMGYVGAASKQAGKGREVNRETSN